MLLDCGNLGLGIARRKSAPGAAGTGLQEENGGNRGALAHTWPVGPQGESGQWLQAHCCAWARRIRRLWARRPGGVSRPGLKIPIGTGPVLPVTG